MSAPYDTSPVPLDAVTTAVRNYWTSVYTPDSSSVPKRKAERALRRLESACSEVMAAIDSLPEGLSRHYLGNLQREAGEAWVEASYRLHRLSSRQPLPPKNARARANLEATIVRLFVKHGGTLSTYDPRRGDAPRTRPDARGRRGGRLARLLLTTYKLAGISAPADLERILVRCRAVIKRDKARRPMLRKYLGELGTSRDPRRILMS